MANIRKQFNFRNGVQVDDDKLIVSQTGLVGIGTTIPTETLDVRGNVKVVGFATFTSASTPSLTAVDSTLTTVNLVESIIGSGVSIKSGIITSNSATGVVTYYGDGVNLLNLPTSQWLDIDVGLGFTSIYAQGNVGVGTVDPRFTFQVGGNADNTLVGFTSGVGISSLGNVLITGVTTSGTFVGVGSDIVDLTASNIAYGLINLDRVPTIPDSKLNNFLRLGIVTTTTLETNDFVAGVGTATNLTVTGTLTGTASTAQGLTGTPDITVNTITANSVSASSFVGGITGDVAGTASTARSLTSDAAVDIADMTVGLATVTGNLLVDGDVGIGTDIPNYNLTLKSTGRVISQVVSNTEALVCIGRSDIYDQKNAALRYGNTSGLFAYSDQESLDLLNYGNGNLNYYIQANQIGLGTGSFYWHKGGGNEPIMALTYGGRLGIGFTNPSSELEVAGLTSTTRLFVKGNTSVGGNLNVNDGYVDAGISLAAPIVYVNNGRDGLLDSTGTSLFAAANVDIQSGVSTFNQLNVEGGLYAESTIGLGGGVRIGSMDPAEIAPPLAPLQVGNGLSEPELCTLIDEGAVGIGTTVIGSSNSLNCYSGTAVFGRVGINTQQLDNVSGALYVQGSIVAVPGGSQEPGNPTITVTGVCTATDGFSSDGSGPVQITVIGNQLTFTVNGVGTTTLTLS